MYRVYKRGNWNKFNFSEGERIIPEIGLKKEKFLKNLRFEIKVIDMHANKEKFISYVSHTDPPGTLNQTRSNPCFHGLRTGVESWTCLELLLFSLCLWLDCKQTSKMAGIEINIKPTSRYLIPTISSPIFPAVPIRFSHSQIKFRPTQKVSWRSCGQIFSKWHRNSINFSSLFFNQNLVNSKFLC